MGIDRGEREDKPKKEVHRKLRDDFHVSDEELFQAWKDYSRKIVLGWSPRTIISMWRKQLKAGIVAPAEKVIDYFTAVGLQLISKEYLEVSHGESLDKLR